MLCVCTLCRRTSATLSKLHDPELTALPALDAEESSNTISILLRSSSIIGLDSASRKSCRSAQGLSVSSREARAACISSILHTAFLRPRTFVIKV